MNSKKLQNMYDELSKQTDARIDEFRAETSEEPLELTMAGQSMGMLGEAFVVLKEAYTLLHAAGKDESQGITKIHEIYTLSWLLNNLIIQYADDNSLDAEVLRYAGQAEMADITTVVFDNPEGVITDYLRSYEEIHLDSVSLQQLLADDIRRIKSSSHDSD